MGNPKNKFVRIYCWSYFYSMLSQDVDFTCDNSFLCCRGPGERQGDTLRHPHAGETRRCPHQHDRPAAAIYRRKR